MKKIKIVRVRAGEYRLESYENGEKIYADTFRGSARDLAKDVRRAKREQPDVDVVWSTATKSSARRGPQRRRSAR